MLHEEQGNWVRFRQKQYDYQVHYSLHNAYEVNRLHSWLSLQNVLILHLGQYKTCSGLGQQMAFRNWLSATREEIKRLTVILLTQTLHDAADCTI